MSRTASFRIRIVAGGGSGNYTPPTTNGEVKSVLFTGSNRLQDIKPGNYSSTQFRNSLLLAYGGGVFVEDYGTQGGYVIAGTGGHTSDEWVDAAIWEVDSGMFRHRPNANGVTPRPSDYQPSEVTASPYTELKDGSGNTTYVPVSMHTYHKPTWIPTAWGGGPDGAFVALQGQGTKDGSNGGPFKKIAHRMNLTPGNGPGAGLWTRVSESLFEIGGWAPSGTYASAVLDKVAGRIYSLSRDLHNQPNNLRYLDLADMTVKLTPTFPVAWPVVEQGVCFIDPVRNLLIIKYKGSGGVYNKFLAVQLDNLAAGWTALTVTNTGVLSTSQHTWVYYPHDDSFYQYRGTGNIVQRLQPPVSGWTGSWTVTERTLLTTPLTQPTTNHHYSRFFHIPAHQCMGWLSDVQNPMQLIRLH